MMSRTCPDICLMITQVSESADGTRITRLEVTRLLRERNEFKEKYLSLLEQIR